VPSVAQAAIQEWRYVERLIAKELKGQKVERPFRYFDNGSMAVVGKNYAVLERGWLRTSGFLTWSVWTFVRVLSLPQLQNRLRGQRQWLWSHFTGQRSSRLISEIPRTSEVLCDPAAVTAGCSPDDRSARRPPPCRHRAHWRAGGQSKIPPR
jgi:NADH:ubiquinone reductase (H+-translocating)